jgi:dTDP-4-amino-4,6-dideoxygalactose transaminase
MIPFNIPYYSTEARELLQKYVLGQIHPTGHGLVTSQFQSQFGFKKTIFTKSCTNALETIALLLNLKPNDEVIVPSFTFVSTANAFALFGAKLVFADSDSNHPNVSDQTVLPLITTKTKAVIVMHYGAVAVQGLEQIRKICDQKGILLIEDAAHCIGAKYNNRYLGTFGHGSTFSFHESKNVSSSEGGLLTLEENTEWFDQAQIIVHKGTNRTQFDQNKVSFYTWVGLGSNYKMENLNALLLSEQIKSVDAINSKRKEIFNFYSKQLDPLRKQAYIYYPDYDIEIDHNAHIFWILVHNNDVRNKLQDFLRQRNIVSTFHYQALHKSPYGKKFISHQTELNNAVKFEENLLRLPLYYDLCIDDASKVVEAISNFFQQVTIR